MATPAEEAEERGLLCREYGDAPAAIRNFTVAVALSDDARLDGARARRAMLLGEALSVVGDFDSADAQYTEVLSDPTADGVVRLNTWRLLSALRLARGQLTEARTAVDEAVRLSPDCPSDGLEQLDLRLQAAFVAEAEGRFVDGSTAELVDLGESYAARSDVAGTRGQGYCRLLLARIALSRHDSAEAIRITNEVLATATEPALYRIYAQALYASGAAHLAAGQFGSALDAFRECVKHTALPELKRVLVEARLGIAASHRALGATDKGLRELQQTAKTLDEIGDNADLEAKYFLSLGLSLLQSAREAPPKERRAKLGLARSALRKADFLRLRLEGADHLGIQVSTALAFVQRTLGRHHQATLTLEQARVLTDSPGVAAVDRGDYLSGLGSSYLRDHAGTEDLDRAESHFRAARGTYTSWYDIARIDQNLAVVDKERADLAAAQADHDDEFHHLRCALDRLVPALLAKFAVRFTLMSQEMRQAWNAQQARGLDVAMGCALRIHTLGSRREPSAPATAEAARLVADLVLVSRIHGVLNPADAADESRDSPDFRRERPGRFADNPHGSGVAPAVADLLAVDDPSLLAPAPRLLAPDGRVVLAHHFARATERYVRYGLPVQHLYRRGPMMRL